MSIPYWIGLKIDEGAEARLAENGIMRTSHGVTNLTTFDAPSKTHIKTDQNDGCANFYANSNNYNFPTSVQSYVHRIGRTGRAGCEGKAVTYFADDDAPLLKAYAVPDRQRSPAIRLHAEAVKAQEVTDGQGEARRDGQSGAED
ncbi:hypothetical protein DFH07DRAFT_1018938 [Mycena maculata]|uniref:RNA helicase n=1 Tax=Mycena maculata TaxID=230809 RepID=A0AAD7JGB4_9AGAR|nr:hypothetical protein DFH07DRAFT_1018938 [Mycena maculata]